MESCGGNMMQRSNNHHASTFVSRRLNKKTFIEKKISTTRIIWKGEAFSTRGSAVVHAAAAPAPQWTPPNQRFSRNACYLCSRMLLDLNREEEYLYRETFEREHFTSVVKAQVGEQVYLCTLTRERRITVGSIRGNPCIRCGRNGSVLLEENYSSVTWLSQEMTVSHQTTGSLDASVVSNPAVTASCVSSTSERQQEL
ncbi:uncharacterized protein LOC116413269 [Galleria mellonella]|uniref:Uncharacterized protein LOC116413269 n=1 Tax=Galleria mellonella TaxID=7137 RepID=A0ABM3MMG7_GALME|nr:uncharacterized protein LOC116413269 [Galleria mellonella]